MESETKRTILTVSASILGVIASFYVAQYTARSEFRNSLQDQVFEARLDHHRHMMEMAYEVTKYADEFTAMADARDLGDRVNKWLYGEGGLYASVTTRGRVKWFRSELLNIRDGETPEEVRGRAKNSITCVITSLRADLDLRGDLSVNRNYEAKLNRFIFDSSDPEKNGSKCCRPFGSKDVVNEHKPPCPRKWYQLLGSEEEEDRKPSKSGADIQP